MDLGPSDKIIWLFSLGPSNPVTVHCLQNAAAHKVGFSTKPCHDLCQLCISSLEAWNGRCNSSINTELAHKHSLWAPSPDDWVDALICILGFALWKPFQQIGICHSLIYGHELLCKARDGWRGVLICSLWGCESSPLAIAYCRSTMTAHLVDVCHGCDNHQCSGHETELQRQPFSRHLHQVCCSVSQSNTSADKCRLSVSAFPFPSPNLASFGVFLFLFFRRAVSILLSAWFRHFFNREPSRWVQLNNSFEGFTVSVSPEVFVPKTLSLTPLPQMLGHSHCIGKAIVVHTTVIMVCNPVVELYTTLPQHFGIPVTCMTIFTKDFIVQNQTSQYISNYSYAIVWGASLLVPGPIKTDSNTTIKLRLTISVDLSHPFNTFIENILSALYNDGWNFGLFLLVHRLHWLDAKNSTTFLQGCISQSYLS